MKLLDDLKIKLLLKLHDPNYEEEIDYWRRYLAKDRLALFDASIKRKAFPAFLKHEVNEFRERHGRAPRLLEVGSGPVSLLIDGVETGEIDVLAVDPLGDQYAKLLSDRGMDYPIKPVRGFAEGLSSVFSPATFDMVYSSNALDHAMSPDSCFRQIIHVTKPGGGVFLEGFVDEGTNGDWHGLHQHDLFIQGKSLVHRSRGGKVANLSQGRHLECTFAETVQFHEREILSYGYEIPKHITPEKSWKFRDWYMIAFRKLG
jgi:SAM-dependent methyltransferase